MKGNISSILFILCLLCLQSARAQRFPFFNLKVENGLVQSQATCLTQDKRGNLWIGTLGGISRYDGKKITNYTVSDGLLSNTIIDLQFSNADELYISTGEGLQVFDGTIFHTVTDEKGQRAKGISQICKGAADQLYFLKQENVFKLDNQKKQLYPVLEEQLTTLYYKNGRLQGATGRGTLLELSGTDILRKTDSIQYHDTDLIILKIFEDSRRQCWLLCNKGLYILNERKIEPYTIRGRQAISTPLLSAAEDKNGQIWLASYIGSFRMSDTVLNYFDQQNGLSDNTIYETLCDQEGNVWLSSDGEGVFRYSGGPFISLDENFGLPNKQVTGITADDKGSIYFSSYLGKLSEYRLGGNIKNIDIPEIKGDVISGMVWYRDRLWIGTRNNGLYIRKNGKNTRYPTEQLGSGANRISSLYPDGKGNLLVGFARNMLSIGLTADTYINLDNAQPICFTTIGTDSLLIASSKGFYLYHNGKASQWNKGSILDSISAQCMTFHDQTVYVGTSEKGILALNLSDQSYTVLNSKNGISSDFIYTLIKDPEGNIWAGTGMGICKISPMGGKQYAVKVFGKANGIIGLECNSNAAFAAPSGLLWFGTTEGVSCYFPSAKPTTAYPLSIVLESVKLFGGRSIDSNFFSGTDSWYTIPLQLKLPYRFNNLSFSFQAITLSPVDKIFYRYILEGSGINWSEWSEENTINFSALEPGKYTLKVQGKTKGAANQIAVMSYSFMIKTPFHKSVWFFISILGSAILLGVYLQYAAHKRKQNRQLREDALRKEEQSRVRERTAEDFHDEVGNKLTRINVLTSVLQSKLGTTNPDAERIIQQIQDNSQQLYAGTRDILWSLQPSNDNLYEILNHVRDLAIELFSETDISFSLSGNDESNKDYKMPLDKSRNFIMIWKEALNNCMKYASPGNVLLQVQRGNEKSIQIRLVDDGAGFDPDRIHPGNGMKNMQSRAARLDGTIQVFSTAGKGTQIILQLPELK